MPVLLVIILVAFWYGYDLKKLFWWKLSHMGLEENSVK